LIELYSNTSVTVTTDYQFDLLRFAAQSDETILVRELDDIKALKQIIFSIPARRRDGDGAIGEAVVFAGYQVAWREHEFKVIFATVRHIPFSKSIAHAQWHLIGPEEPAQQLIHSCALFCSTYRDSVWVFDQFWRPDHELWLSVQKADWKDVILDQKFKDAVQHDYRSFFRSEQIYKDLEVPWKRGLIFLGPPGNGKTISLKAIMKEVNVPALYVKSFRTWNGDEAGIREIFSHARRQAPCVLVLEDLDSLITDLNRSFFLNEVDGLEDNDGLLLIGTTNHFDRLDPALSSRPSRFDRKYDFPNPTRSERRQYAEYWQGKLKDNKLVDFPDSLLDEVADKTDKFSFAYLKEAFVSTLLTLAGEDSDGKTPENFRDVILAQIKHLRDSIHDGAEELTMAGSWARKATTSVDGRGQLESDQKVFDFRQGSKRTMSSPIDRAKIQKGFAGKQQCFQIPT
ncbi:P-loop containing nucleoside triphosphate hydrolase protein, partial [Naematelia encephala]